MKKFLLLLSFIVTSGIAYCQNPHSIKFIYEGDILHLFPPLIISIDKLNTVVNPYSLRYLQTDTNTFNYVRNYIRTSKYTLLYKKDSNTDRFKIINANGRIYFMYGRHIGRFSHDLQYVLTAKNLDKQVIQILNFY